MRWPWALAAAMLLEGLIAPALAQSAPDDPAIGLYRFSRGREVYVEYLRDIEGLAVVEFPSGRVRPLQHRNAHDRFSFGPSIGASEPIEAELIIEGGRLRWTERGRVARARRVAFVTEDVVVNSGDVTLTGTLTRPRGRGPFPAVVLLHGGGAQTRDFFWTPHFFAARGFAVLAYDKRGVGGSSGDWRTAGARDLAQDALAAVDYLRGRADIRGERVGLYGASAGGWIAPLAVSLAPERIAFVIARSASALPERENVIYEVEGDLRDAGYGEDVVARARALHEQEISVVDAGGEGWEALRAALQSANAEPWFTLTRLPADLIPRTPENETSIADYIAGRRANRIDPPALWRMVRTPVLIQLGGRDRYVPGPQSAAALRESLAGNPQAMVLLYPAADHPMFASPTGYPSAIPQVTHYAEGYLADLDSFARRMARR